MQEDSIFTKIVNGEIPANKVYEDEHTLAFLDIHPIQPGHTLVIPKKQVEFTWDLDEETYKATMATAKKVATRIKEVLNPAYVGEQIIGVEVPHAHIHIIPFNTVAEFRNQPDKTQEPDFAGLAEMAKKLAF